MEPMCWVEDNDQAYTPRTKKKPKKKIKFDGWASRELIEFLKSIDKDTSKPISHYDVTNIVNQYVIDNKLILPEKKKRVICDERLQFLFGGKKKSVLRNKIQNLLEPHLVENHVDSDEDLCSSEDYEEDSSVPKRQKLSTVDKNPFSKKKVVEVPKSSLAAICPENIKLIYLKRSLVQDIVRHPQTFESKVVGSFVKSKSDPYDIYQKNPHQLYLVTGVKEVTTAGAMLQLASMTEGISISALSDDNFSEEECEDLLRRFNDGLLKKLTVGEWEQKVAILHEDITKHWLARELVLLKIRTDQANEKGWRHKVAEFRDRRRLLETPAEQSRLLNEIPAVVPEKVESETIPDDSPDCVNHNTDDSPKDDDWDWEPCYSSSAKGVSPKVSSKPDSQEPVKVGTRSNGGALPSRPRKESPLETEQVKTEINGNIKPLEPIKTTFCRIETLRTESNCHAESLIPVSAESNDHLLISPKARDSCVVIPNPKAMIPVRAESNDHLLISPKRRDSCVVVQNPKEVEVIALSDDEEELEIPSSNKLALFNLEFANWHYLDPSSRVQGPFSLTSLKRWSDLGYFQPGFRVWMKGQRPNEAILLSNVLQHAFPS